jgi:hypothetical protein
MVAARAGSGVEADLGVQLLEPVDESIDAGIVSQQAGGIRIIATEDAADGGVEEEHPKPVERARTAVRLQEQDSRNGRAPHLDLSGHGFDIIHLKGADVVRLGQVLGSIGRS